MEVDRQHDHEHQERLTTLDLVTVPAPPSQSGGIPSDRANPLAALIVDQAGNIYSTTFGGGAGW